MNEERVYSGTRAENLEIALDRTTGMYDKTKIPGCKDPNSIYVVTHRYADNKRALRGQILMLMLDDWSDMDREMLIFSGMASKEEIKPDPESHMGFKIGPTLKVDKVMDVEGFDITDRFLS